MFFMIILSTFEKTLMKILAEMILHLFYICNDTDFSYIILIIKIDQ